MLDAAHGNNMTAQTSGEAVVAGASTENARCAISDRNLHSGMPLDPTHVRLKLLQACGQWHSSRASTCSYRLAPVNCVQTLQVTALAATLTLTLTLTMDSAQTLTTANCVQTLKDRLRFVDFVGFDDELVLFRELCVGQPASLQVPVLAMIERCRFGQRGWARFLVHNLKTFFGGGSRKWSGARFRTGSCTLEDAIGSHAFAPLEALACV